MLTYGGPPSGVVWPPVVWPEVCGRPSPPRDEARHLLKLGKMQDFQLKHLFLPPPRNRYILSDSFEKNKNKNAAIMLLSRFLLNLTDQFKSWAKTGILQDGMERSS
jgi:hypothetical protein